MLVYDTISRNDMVNGLRDKESGLPTAREILNSVGACVNLT